MDHACVRNISDDLDRGTIGFLIIPGDLVFIQGSYLFTDIPPDGSGADNVRGRRSVNGVEISFVFNRNEGTSGSARNEWLRGVHSLGCLLRVNKVERRQKKLKRPVNKLKRDFKEVLHIEATVLAIRSAHDELKSRTYEIGLYRSGLIGYVVEEEELEDPYSDCLQDDGDFDDLLPS